MRAGTMMRARTMWLVFAIASAVVAAVMLGVSWALVRLDDSRVEGRRDAAREELVRLALWRMDGVLTPVLSREIAEAGMPLGDGPPPRGVRARFVIHPGGAADTIGTVDPEVESQLLALIAAQEPERTLLAFDDATRDVAGTYRNAKGNLVVGQGMPSDRSVMEYNKRVVNAQDNFVQSSSVNPTYKSNDDRGEAVLDGRQQALGGLDPRGPNTELQVPVAVLELMRPLWWGDELVMVRRVESEDGERIDGS